MSKEAKEQKTDAAAKEQKTDAAAKESTPAEKSFPPTIASLKGKPMEGVLRQWSQQRERGQITICSEERCYYPLEPARSDDNGQAVETEETDRGTAIVARCTWDHSHGGGKQFIYPPKKKGDDSPANLKG